MLNKENFLSGAGRGRVRPCGDVTRCCSVVDQQLDHSVSQSVSQSVVWESPELLTARTDWTGDDGGEKRRGEAVKVNNEEEQIPDEQQREGR